MPVQGTPMVRSAPLQVESVARVELVELQMCILEKQLLRLPQVRQLPFCV